MSGISCVEFSKEEKQQNFDKLCELFYKSNFGQASKQEIDLLMFNFYMEHLIKDDQDGYGELDSKTCSDYVMSKQLGITQQRVRNLKIKKQLVYPHKFNWQKAFLKQIQYATYDERRGMIIVNLKDPNLVIEVENFIEMDGGYIEESINNKILRIRPAYFIQLLLSINDDVTSKKAIIKEIKKTVKKNSQDDNAFDDKEIGKSILESSSDVIGIIDGIINIANSLSNPLQSVATLVGAFSHIKKIMSKVNK